MLRVISVLILASLLVFRPVGASTPDSVTCVIVRTYHEQGDARGNGALRAIIKSLQQQTSDRWVALLAVLDNFPFQELRYILRDIADDRVSVAAEWIGQDNVAFSGSSWSESYLIKLHKLTDEAIRACPPHTAMVVVTNADNLYDAGFVEEVERGAAAGADLVAVDWYSRYQRPTAAPCERFAWAEGAPACKENEMRLCQTDFAANAYRWRRLVDEAVRLEPTAAGVAYQGTGEAAVGLVSAKLVEQGWKLHRTPGRCLLHHRPSPQNCALLGGMAWDDSRLYNSETHGGSCIPLDAAIKLRGKRPSKLEILDVNLTFDPRGSGFEGRTELRLPCLRASERERWWHVQTFGRMCAATGDVPDLPAELPLHPWDVLMGLPGEQAEAVGEGEEGEGVEKESLSEGGTQETTPSG